MFNAAASSAQHHKHAVIGCSKCSAPRVTMLCSGPMWAPGRCSSLPPACAGAPIMMLVLHVHALELRLRFGLALLFDIGALWGFMADGGTFS